MTHEQYVITPAELADIEDIMRVEKNAFASGVVEESASFRERLEAFPQGFLLLKDGGRIVGYFCGELWDGGLKSPYPASLFTLGHSAQKSHRPDGTKLYISSMGIFSDYRGRGLGGYLFNASVDYITQNTPRLASVILLVNETWLPARAIYQKAGFSEVQVLPGFFTDIPEGKKTRQNGIIMEKELAAHKGAALDSQL